MPYKDPEYQKKYRLEHKEQIREYFKEYRQIHREHKKELCLKYYQEHKEEICKKSKEWAETHKEQVKRNQKEYRETHKDRNELEHKRITIDVLSHYSEGQPKCACCGESQIEFLTIDHINGHTENDVRTKFISKSQPYYRFIAGYKLYRWLRQNNYPKGYQVLCYNCNCGKNRTKDKVCPHKFSSGLK